MTFLRFRFENLKVSSSKLLGSQGLGVSKVGKSGLTHISYTLDSAFHPAGERKLKPDRSRILREAAILVVPTERDNLYILYCGNGQS